MPSMPLHPANLRSTPDRPLISCTRPAPTTKHAARSTRCQEHTPPRRPNTKQTTTPCHMQEVAHQEHRASPTLVMTLHLGAPTYVAPPPPPANGRLDSPPYNQANAEGATRHCPGLLSTRGGPRTKTPSKDTAQPAPPSPQQRPLPPREGNMGHVATPCPRSPPPPARRTPHTPRKTNNLHHTQRTGARLRGCDKHQLRSPINK